VTKSIYGRVNGVDGAQGVNNLLSTLPITTSPDGLMLDTAKAPLDQVAAMPDRLWTWLLDLRLLRHVPLSYLVPDSTLLPPESIRFFRVDLTWIDRVLDGVFSAANTGTVDIAFSAALLQVARQSLDDALVQQAADYLADHAKQAGDAGSGNFNRWSPANGMTGMLIRSEAVRRWPNMIVSAFSDETIPDPDKQSSPPETVRMPVLRAEPISSDVYIALFGGTPALVQVSEPPVGTRFGLEQDQKDKHLYFNNADAPPGVTKEETPVKLVDGIYRALPITGTDRTKNCGNSPAAVGANLLRPPYIQQFKHSVTDEDRGSQSPFDPFGNLKVITLRNGRAMNLQRLGDRFNEQKRLGKL
jgi:hypothetical protein